MTVGNDVREMQGYLKVLGFYAAEPTGVFDEKTADAAAAYRKSKGQEAPGPFGRGLGIELLKQLRKEARAAGQSAAGSEGKPR